MKRFLSILTSALLVASLAMPAVVWAAKGGNANGAGRATAPGQNRDATTERIKVSPGQDHATTHEEGSTGSGNGTAAGRSETADAHASENGSETVMARDRVRVRESMEGSDTANPTRSGTANAFDRISANLAAAEARVARGSAKTLPPGLVRVFEKFLDWLGLAPDDTPVDDTDTGQGTDEPQGSHDATDTPTT